MRPFTLPLLLNLTIILTACTAAGPTSDQPAPSPAPVSTQPISPETDTSDLARLDQQGTVTVEVTPLNLDVPTETLEFHVVMDTHSVDLSMDLAALSTLTTDTGVTLGASSWDAPLGGHHVQGKLIFPAAKDGKSILDGADKLTLTITNVDVPSRLFEWQLP